jgi:hypothetical protein
MCFFAREKGDVGEADKSAIHLVKVQSYSRLRQPFFKPNLLDFYTLFFGGQLLFKKKIKFIVLEP